MKYETILELHNIIIFRLYTSCIYAIAKYCFICMFLFYRWSRIYSNYNIQIYSFTLCYM